LLNKSEIEPLTQPPNDCGPLARSHC